MDWKVLKKSIDDENARILRTPPEDVLRVFKYEILTTGAATGGLMLAPWFEGATASRYIGAYYVYNIVKLASVPGYTMEEIKEMTRLLLPKAVGTAKLCGMTTFAKFSEQVLSCIAGISESESLLQLLNSLYLYGSNMNAWIHHYMKWGIGQAFRIPTREELLDMGMRNVESYI